MVFPKDYPNHPPTLRITSDFWHPNVYPDGRVCISILHAPGEDSYGYESASERWLPIHTVESILVSVISMISSPNEESPANIDAAVRRHAIARARSPALARRLVRPQPARREATGALATRSLSCLHRRLAPVSQKERRDDPAAYRKRVQKIVRRSQEG